MAPLAARAAAPPLGNFFASQGSDTNSKRKQRAESIEFQVFILREKKTL